MSGRYNTRRGAGGSETSTRKSRRRRTRSVLRGGAIQEGGQPGAGRKEGADRRAACPHRAPGSVYAQTRPRGDSGLSQRIWEHWTGSDAPHSVWQSPPGLRPWRQGREATLTTVSCPPRPRPSAILKKHFSVPASPTLVRVTPSAARPPGCAGPGSGFGCAPSDPQALRVDSRRYAPRALAATVFALSAASVPGSSS